MVEQKNAPWEAGHQKRYNYNKGISMLPQVNENSNKNFTLDDQSLNILLFNVRQQAYKDFMCQQRRKSAARAHHEEAKEPIKAKFDRYFNENAHKLSRGARASFRRKLNALANNKGKRRKLRQINEAKKAGISVRTQKRYDNEIRRLGLLRSVQSVYKDNHGRARKGALIWFHPDENYQLPTLPKRSEIKISRKRETFSGCHFVTSLYRSIDISRDSPTSEPSEEAEASPKDSLPRMNVDSVEAETTPNAVQKPQVVRPSGWNVLSFRDRRINFTSWQIKQPQKQRHCLSTPPAKVRVFNHPGTEKYSAKAVSGLASVCDVRYFSNTKNNNGWLEMLQTKEIIDRTYQVELFENTRRALKQGYRRPLLQAATGSGKTRIAAAIANATLRKNNRVLMVAPRRKLVYQAYDTFDRFGLDPRIVMAGEEGQNMGQCMVASKDTLYHRGLKNRTMMMPPANVLLLDECHLSLSSSWLEIINYYRDSVIIGFTATPARGDGRGLGEVYDTLIPTWSIGKLIEYGYLVPIRYFAPSKPDLEGVKTAKGDYVVEGEKGLAKRLEDNTVLIGDIVENWFRLASDKKTIVFSVTCAHGRHICNEFLRWGVSAEYIDGNTEKEEQKAIIARVESGETQVIVNCMLMNYGVDIPSLECVVLARPTKSIVMYHQAVGRVLRPLLGKTEALVIDHAGIVEELGFVEDEIPWSLDAKETVQERREKQRKEKQEPKEIECPKCDYAFKGSRICPNCKHELIPPGKPVPVYKAELEEISKERRKQNKEMSFQEKAEFYAQLRWYAQQKGYREGWAAHKYRARCGVFPNDKRVRSVDPFPPTVEVSNWIKYQQIRDAKSRNKEVNRAA